MKSKNKNKQTKSTNTIEKLNSSITNCKLCPRLRSYCTEIAKTKRAAYQTEKYWGRPVPNFGSTPNGLLVVGLAPAAHGANRTGRMFTGDRSGQWLYRALHRAGFASQSTFESADDGLQLINCAITAIAHCAPPDNKPTPDEVANCSRFLQQAVDIYKPQVILALGAIAWRRLIELNRKQDLWSGSIPAFKHGGELRFTNDVTLLASYHPSQQNTFTKVLTEPMFDAVFSRARILLKA